MKPTISVIICTHNPKPEYIERVLQALKVQSLSLKDWELLLIDNASNQNLASIIDLSWHVNARHVREEKLGLTPARLRGIREATSQTLVFVDDDNILDVDYLKITMQISQEWPMLGAWGGQNIPNFEEQPPSWIKPYLPLLALREFDRDKWSNLIFQYETAPCGAGICVRKVVAEKYADSVNTDPRRAMMGRKGKLLTASEDMDLAFTACDMNLGTGQFTSLKLTHLIPAQRVKEDYLLRLREGASYSTTLLHFIRGQLPPKRPWFIGLLRYCRRWLMDTKTRQCYDASERGIALAIKDIAKF